MITFRQQQLGALSQCMRRHFEAHMVEHLRSRFPADTDQLDDGALRKLIISGIARAESYGIEFEADLQRFLDYMMVLSFDFDTAPRTAWAGEILQGCDLGGGNKMSQIDNAYIFRYRMG